VDRNLPFGLTFTALVAFAITWFFQQSFRTAVDYKFLAPPPEHLELFSFGFKESMADSLWLRWIQDSDSCYAYLKPVETLDKEDQEQKKHYDDEFFNPRHKRCDQSWGFKMLDAVTKLDPRFKMPYLAGTMALSVMVEDYEGASVIFDRGLSVYPDDWTLNYRASYHFVFDRHDYAKGASLLAHAAEVGGPFWFKALAARLYSKTGQIELGLNTLLALRKQFEDKPNYTKSLDERIGELRKQMAEQQRNGTSERK
jgi:hypothetical protein